MPSTNAWFRQRGTYFPNAVATTPLCCPSRASILSGRYVHNNGVRSNLEGDHLDHSTTATDSAGAPFCACQAMESGHPVDREF